MQETIEYTAINNGISPATVKLLIRERSRGKALRQLGQMFGISHEGVRQFLIKFGQPQVSLLPGKTAAGKSREVERDTVQGTKESSA